MKRLSWSQYLLIGMTFLLALMLEVMHWPQEWQGVKPAWLVMVLMYWIMALPERINILCAFLVGICWDLITGAILGVHSTILVIFAYLISRSYCILRNLSLWFQAFLVFIFVLFIRLGLFLLEFFLYQANFNGQEIYGALLSALLWPWIYLLLRKLRQKMHVK